MRTGIFKYPVDEPIVLGNEDVEKDDVMDRKYHGGVDKACYLYSADHYDYWQKQYPELEMPWGMFGENLTVSDVDEAEILIGDIYKIGDAIVQVSQPRQPCNKFAAKFGSTELIRQFIDYEHPGIYFRVIQSGNVQPGDELMLDLRNNEALSLQQIFQLLYAKKEKVNAELAEQAIFDPNLAGSAKDSIRRHWKI